MVKGFGGCGFFYSERAYCVQGGLSVVVHCFRHSFSKSDWHSWIVVIIMSMDGGGGSSRDDDDDVRYNICCGGCGGDTGSSSSGSNDDDEKVIFELITQPP